MTDDRTETDAAVAVENMLLLRRQDFDELLERAAERGAERVLTHLGLENGLEHTRTAQDIGELRALLEAWRDARRTAWQTVIKVLTTGLLAALVAGVALKPKLFGGGQ